MELIHMRVDCSYALLYPLIKAYLKLYLSCDDWSHVWFILDCSMVE